MSGPGANERPALRVLVTRPRHQQQGFIEQCHSLGFQTSSLPCIDILPLTASFDPASATDADMVLFTSRNAVDFAHRAWPLPWPGVSAFAIGRSTARALQRHGQALSHEPVEPFTSEALIENLDERPAMAQAIIIRGAEGRTLLLEYLQGRGARVETVDVYRRIRPVVSDTERHRAFIDEPSHVISVTSDEILRNLVDIAGGEYGDHLRQRPLILNSERCAELAQRLGFEESLMVANPPGDEGQLATLQQFALNY